MKTRMKLLVAAATALVTGCLMALRGIAVETLAGMQHDLVATANTYDAAVETHPNTVRRTNDVAVTTRHLLWKKGAGDLTVALAGVADWPMGTIDNVEPATGTGQTIKLLGKGDTKKVVASAAIAVGALIVPAANGKARTLPTAAGTYYVIGASLTPAGADNDILEIQDCVPYQVVVPA